MADERQAYTSRTWQTGDVITKQALNNIEDEMGYVSAEINNAVTGTINSDKVNDTIARKLDSIVKYFPDDPNPDTDLEYVRMYAQPSTEGTITVPTEEEYLKFKQNFVQPFTNKAYTAGSYVEYEDEIYKVKSAIAKNNSVADDAAAWTAILALDPSPIRKINVMQEVDNLINVYTNDSQLTTEQNRIWIQQTGETVQTPSMQDFVNFEGSMVSAYSASKSYAVGDYVYLPTGMVNNTTNDYKIYRCKTACSAAAWTTNSTNFTVAQVTSDLKGKISQLKSALQNTGLYEYVQQPFTVENSVINTNGVSNLGSNFRHATINVESGEQYTVSGYKFSSSFPGYIFMNGDSVDSYETTLASSQPFNDVNVTIPSGITQMIVNGSATDVVVIKKYTCVLAEKKSDSDKNRSNIANIEMAINTIAPTIYEIISPTINGGVYSKTNVLNNNPDFKHCIISTRPGEKFKITAYRVSDTYPLYIYRYDGVIVSYENTLTNDLKIDYEIIVPENVNELVINSNIANGITVKKEEYMKAGSQTEVEKKANTPVEWIEQAGTLVNGYLYGSPTTQAAGPTWSYRTYTNSNGFENGKVKVTGTNFSAYFSLVIYLNSNGALISKETGLDNNTAYFDHILSNIPADCRTIVVNNAELVNGTGSEPHIFTGGAQISVDECAIFYAKREAEKATLYENLPTGYEGKKIAFFGTSIMSNAVYNIPRYAAEVLGFDIINEALGSSCARRGWKSRKTANDPYGWTGTSWQNVFLAMGASLAEKQDLIDNYTTKWADLLGGDYQGSSGDGTGTGKPQTLSQEWIIKIQNASYEKKLIPYLDGTKPMPDLFIFEHGYNDYDPNDPLTGEVQNESNLDMSVYSDAMYFYIQKIFEANPQAKVMICSHYENQTTRGDTVWSAQKELASYHGLWFCDVANGIGWTQRKVKTTGYWDTTTHLWIPSGGSLQTITRKQQCLYDDLHPHNDWSGNASRREGQIIAQFIRSHIVL